MFYTKNLEKSEAIASFLCKEEDADYALISIEEYHGFQKALRIVRERALQQIDKGQADKHGYTLLRAEEGRYSYDYDSPAWLITMRSPYSIKIPLKEVSFLIKKDLTDFYGFVELPMIYDRETEKYTRLNIKDYFSFVSFHAPSDDFSSIIDSHIIQLLNFLNSCDWKFAFKIRRLVRNAATGCYEVSYWATDPM